MANFLHLKMNSCSIIKISHQPSHSDFPQSKGNHKYSSYPRNSDIFLPISLPTSDSLTSYYHHFFSELWSFQTYFFTHSVSFRVPVPISLLSLFPLHYLEFLFQFLASSLCRVYSSLCLPLSHPLCCSVFLLPFPLLQLPLHTPSFFLPDFTWSCSLAWLLYIFQWWQLYW